MNERDNCFVFSVLFFSSILEREEKEDKFFGDRIIGLWFVGV